MRVLIAGGNAGGASVATRLRRLRPDAEVVIFERGQYVSFANCGLLYHIEGTIKDRSALFVETAESLRTKHGIDVRLQSEVVGISPDAHSIVVQNAMTRTRTIEHYDKLVLAMGAESVVPRIPGVDAPDIIPMWSLPNMDRIIEAINRGAHSAVILGAGYVGCVMAEALHERGLAVTIVEARPQVLPFLDADMAEYALGGLRSHDITVRPGESVERFSPRPTIGQTVTLAGGSALDADLVVLAVGVRPASRIAADAGLAIGDSGGIVVNSSLRTSDADIYAVGDAIEVIHSVSGQAGTIALAGPAHQQARIAATNIAGLEPGWSDHYRGTQGSAIVKLFDMSYGSTGANSDQLQRRSISFDSIVIHTRNHAGYYPNATPVHLKLLYGSDGRVLGAQAAGQAGIDKRLDVLATAIYFGATVTDLANLQLAYSPPFGSARDAVNIAGSAAEARLKSRGH
jgi:NADPH-dependent 2,4-dienoyl-CoA reductase/sulfur reductase-like enzyme